MFDFSVQVCDVFAHAFDVCAYVCDVCAHMCDVFACVCTCAHMCACVCVMCVVCVNEWTLIWCSVKYKHSPFSLQVAIRHLRSHY